MEIYTSLSRALTQYMQIISIHSNFGSQKNDQIKVKLIVLQGKAPISTRKAHTFFFITFQSQTA